MLRFTPFFLALLVSFSALSAAPVPNMPPRLTGILVLDDCDEVYLGKEVYKDNLTFLDRTGKQLFRVSGFNTCEAIGSSHLIATDPARKCIWVLELVAHCIRRFDYSGKEMLCIEGVSGSAIAIDPETGNVWAVVGPQNGRSKTVVYDDKGKEVDSYDVSGWDIVYDRKSKAFLIAEKKLTKLSAAKGEVLFTVDVSTWCSSSLDVDPKTGAVWVAVREYQKGDGSSNQLLKFDPAGKPLATIGMGDKTPFRVSVNSRNGSVWVVNMRKSVERFSAEGKSEAEFPVEALAVQVDPSGNDVWVVTPEDVRRLTPKGEVLGRFKHASKTSQAWIAALE